MKIKKMISILLLLVSNIAVSETISEIQGKKLVSEFTDKKVTKVQGVVTLLRKNKYNNGFFMQSLKADKDSRTSEGIYIENLSSVDVKVGDLVQVDGNVKEIYFGKVDPLAQTMTAINAESLKVLDTNKKVKPKVFDGKFIPRKVHDGNKKVLNISKNALDYMESLEGMVIRIKKPLITGSNEKYGTITVVPNYGKYAETRSVNGGVVYNNYTYEQTQRISIDSANWKLVENFEYKDGLTPNPGDIFI